MNTTLLLRTILLSCLLYLTSFVTFAQGTSGFPTRPIRIVVPTPAGGPSDGAARMLAQALSASLGQQVIVENRPGASGVIAAQAVLSAPNDGYTLLWAQGSMAGLPFVQKSPPFKSLNEFAPISLVLNFGYALFANNEVPAKTFAELVAFGKARPSQLSYATGTLGEFMAAAYVLKAAGIQGMRVPYKGGAQLMPDLITGQVQLNFGPIVSGQHHVKAGKLKMLATLLPQRLGSAPDVPTLGELGISTAFLPTWNALFAPPNTAREISSKLSAEILKALQSPSIRNTLELQGSQVIGSTPQQLAEAVEASSLAWRNFVSDYDIPKE